MKFYKVFLSKTDIVIDEEDFDKVAQGMSSGSFVKLKNAIINPSFISHVLPITQQEALEREAPPEKIEGYVDRERNVFVVTKELRPQVTKIADKFKM